MLFMQWREYEVKMHQGLFLPKHKRGRLCGSQNNQKFISEKTTKTIPGGEKTVKSRTVVPMNSGDSGILVMEIVA